jgi:hypothetical protein
MHGATIKIVSLSVYLCQPLEMPERINEFLGAARWHDILIVVLDISCWQNGTM